MNKRYVVLLVLIFMITLSTRLFLAFATPNFTYESYFNLRQVESIIETGLPIITDDLSYGGRNFVLLPFFHYITAFFSLFLSLEIIAKILPNLFLSLLTVIVFLISLKISKSEKASLFSAGISGFLPIIFAPNSFTVNSLFLPLIFLNIYAFINIQEKKHLLIYILSFLLLCFISSATFFLLVGFAIYLLLSRLENKKIDHSELEIIIFSLFFFIWTQFIFFKNFLLDQGISFIWQNIPPQIVNDYFPSFSLVQALVLVSIIPFLAGIIVVYNSLFNLKNQKAFLLISLAISTTLLTWLKIIPFTISLSFFGIILSILFSLFYIEADNYLTKTRLISIKKYFVLIIVLLLLSTMAYPAISNALNQEIPSDEEIAAFSWLKENSPEDSIIAASLQEGHLITYFGQRKNFMDDRFALIDDIEQRYTDLNLLLTTRLQTQAIDTFDRNKIDFIVITPTTVKKYDLENVPRNLPYYTLGCFKNVYENQTIIYKVKCELEKEAAQ